MTAPFFILAVIGWALYIWRDYCGFEDGVNLMLAEYDTERAKDALRDHLATCGLATVTRIHPEHEPTSIAEAAHDAAVFDQMTAGLDERPGHETWEGA